MTKILQYEVDNIVTSSDGCPKDVTVTVKVDIQPYSVSNGRAAKDIDTNYRSGWPICRTKQATRIRSQGPCHGSRKL